MEGRECLTRPYRYCPTPPPQVTPSEKLVAVSTYFLVEGPGGKVNQAGDRTVRFFTLDAAATKLTAHPTKPIVDLKTLLGDKGIYNPHGMAFSQV